MEIVFIKQTDAPLSDADRSAVLRFLFQYLDGCNDRDRKAWRAWWRSVADAPRGQYFTVSIKRQRHGAFHRLLMAVMQKVFDAQEKFDNFNIFRGFVKLGAGFADYIPDLETGELKAHPKSQSFDECSEEEIRQFFDDALKFLRKEACQRILWPHLSPVIAEQSVEAILSQFDRPTT